MTNSSVNEKSGKIILFFLAITTLLVTSSVMPLQYATAQDDPDDTFTLDLKNIDIHSLIETVSTRTGRNFIVDPRVKATINVVSSEPLNADTLYDLFLSVLEVHGYTAVQAGAMTKIVPSSIGVQSAVPFASERPNAGDELISQVILLRNMPVLEVVEALRPLLPETASITAERSSNTVVLTDRAANVAKLIELILLMDGQ